MDVALAIPKASRPLPAEGTLRSSAEERPRTGFPPVAVDAAGFSPLLEPAAGGAEGVVETSMLTVGGESGSPTCDGGGCRSVAPPLREPTSGECPMPTTG